MSDTERLKRCPCCGHSATIVNEPQQTINGVLTYPCVYIKCTNCFIRTESRTYTSDTDRVFKLDWLIDAWNKREPEQSFELPTVDEQIQASIEYLMGIKEEFENTMAQLSELSYEMQNTCNCISSSIHSITTTDKCVTCVHYFDHHCLHTGHFACGSDKSCTAYVNQDVLEHGEEDRE